MRGAGAYSTRLWGALLAALLVAALVPIAPAPAARASTDKIDPALLQLMAADPSAPLPIVVEMERASAPFAHPVNAQLAQRALDLIALHGGSPVGGLAIIDSAAGWANAATIQALSAQAAVAYVHEDSLIRPRKGKEPITKWSPGLLSAPYPRVLNADRTWSRGVTGKGVTVAVLDSGVNDDPDLGTRVVARANFAGDRGLMQDAGGHGTHVAGIVAGDGTASEKEYVGVAPRANVADVRVLNRNGNGRVSSVVRGIEWSLAHRATYNIRVINLAFGAPAARSYRLDPMSAAMQVAWKFGVVVVAAAGNGGPGSGTVERPGIDPYAITVGSTDDQGTVSVGDDALAWFSAWGTPPDSTAKPDVVTPGRRIVSLRAAGSALETLFPGRVVVAKNGATYFRMTGTSMSTGMVSGVVALMLQARPNLRPDQVKSLLTGTTQPYGQSSTPPPDPSADGAGLVDALAATSATPLPPANRDLRPSDAFARTLYPILHGGPLEWIDPNYLGIDWASLTWDSVAWDSVAWDNYRWDSVAWDSVAWDSVAWDSVAWDSVAWDSVAWDSVAWDSLTLD